MTTEQKLNEIKDKIDEISKKSGKTGVGGLTLLGIAFIVLKLCGVISWSWFWVLFPFFIPLALVIILTIILLVFVKLSLE